MAAPAFTLPSAALESTVRVRMALETVAPAGRAPASKASADTAVVWPPPTATWSVPAGYGLAAGQPPGTVTADIGNVPAGKYEAAVVLKLKSAGRQWRTTLALTVTEPLSARPLTFGPVEVGKVVKLPLVLKNAGAPLKDAVSLANLAAGVVVGKLGTATVAPKELLAAIHELK